MVRPGRARLALVLPGSAPSKEQRRPVGMLMEKQTDAAWRSTGPTGVDASEVTARRRPVFQR